MTKPCDKKAILEILENSEFKLTPLNLIKKIVIKTGGSSTSAKQTIKELTAQKELAYTYFFGSTYIELSFNKPVKISDRFILTPAGIKKTHRKKEINIIIDPGISFGSGRHPTTRLALSALDHIKLKGSDNNLSGLDIGTGSGVLAIAACKTHVSSCIALDIDPNAIAEAQRNVLLNNLENKIKVSDREIDTINQKFSLLIANLRYPTLKQLAEKITWLSENNSVLIMSGIRTYEKDGLITLYTKKGFQLLREKDEKNWSCITMQSKG